MNNTKNFNYSMKYLIASDDTRPSESVYEMALQKGDIIKLADGFYYCVVAVINVSQQVTHEEPQPTLVLSGSALSPEDAMSVAINSNHLPETFWSLESNKAS